MPPLPETDGLPLWLRIVIALAFGLAALLAAIGGYFKADRTPSRQTGEGSAILGASIADMGAIRRLSDVCAELTRHFIDLGAKIEHLERTLQDDIHFRRQANDIGNELCQRMRELREAIDRASSR